MFAHLYTTLSNNLALERYLQLPQITKTASKMICWLLFNMKCIKIEQCENRTLCTCVFVHKQHTSSKAVYRIESAPTEKQCKLNYNMRNWRREPNKKKKTKEIYRPHNTRLYNWQFIHKKCNRREEKREKKISNISTALVQSMPHIVCTYEVRHTNYRH